MAKLHHIKIQHFRGIDNFEQIFANGIMCIIGRGDSGKSTILEAISYVFSQSWSLHLNDSDFYGCNTTIPIIIEGTVVEIPDDLIVKFNNHLRGIDKEGRLIDDMESEEASDNNVKTALTIQLKVTKDLEPSWSVVSYHGVEQIPIKANDRGKLNVFAVTDYTDKHFSLNKGNPLYSLYKQLNGTAVIDEENRVLDVIREAKEAFDNSVGVKFDSVIDKIKKEAEMLGVSLKELNAMLDHRDIAISENKVSIHEEGIPFRLKGKGSKRLLSLAIQLAMTQPSGVILIDEIEQGLEPDRVQHLVNELAKLTERQVIITTHSSNVAVELTSSSMYIMKKNAHQLLQVGKGLQDCIRKNPEAFFAKKIVICEGATEIGICRALNDYRMTLGLPSAACEGVRFVDGTGNAMKHYVEEFVSLGYPTALFCDSDPEGKEINDLKPSFKEKGVEVIDCEEGFSIEGQVFKDLPWEIVKELVNLYFILRVENEKSSDLLQANKDVFSMINARLSTRQEWKEDWYEEESNDLREALYKAAGNKSWFKRIDLGQKMGKCILDHYDELPTESRVKVELDSISRWINT